jgi:hypothetical protein
VKFLGKAKKFVHDNPLEAGAFAVSLIALTLSIIVFVSQSGEHSDTLTSNVIRETYKDFIQLDDIRAQYPLQGHLFETPTNYPRYNKLVMTAAGGKTMSDAEQAKLLLEEAAMAERVFSMFEHSLFQWMHGKQNADKARVEFLKAVLDYYTGRILPNPRLMWYWSKTGANLSEHFETVTIQYYNDNVKPTGKEVDARGPFLKFQKPGAPGVGNM